MNSSTGLSVDHVIVALLGLMPVANSSACGSEVPRICEGHRCIDDLPGAVGDDVGDIEQGLVDTGTNHCDHLLRLDAGLRTHPQAMPVDQRGPAYVRVDLAGTRYPGRRNPCCLRSGR